MSRHARQRRRRRARGGPAKVVFLVLGLLAGSIVIGAAAAVGYIVSVANSAPPLETLKPANPGENSVVYAADGTRMGVIQSDILRQDIPSSSMPEVMRQATVAIEDKRFYQHQGVDLEGIVRAAIKNVESKGESVQGGSTLTMQLIKNIYTGKREREGIEGYKRKIREAKLAEELENVHPGPEGKKWILTKYLNNVPYGTVGGQEAIGIQAAARVFFNKRAADLTLPEAALLAGLPQAPTTYNPYLNPEGAKARRSTVLDAMVDMGYITRAEADEAAAAPLGLEQSRYYKERRENYFFDYVRAELVRKYGVDRVRQGGLRVYTTVDFRRQKLARSAISKNLAAPGSPSAAIVSIDPKSGHILAMASSEKYGASKFNLAAQGKRQPGSTFKIIGLMDAIHRGVDIRSTSYVSRPLNFVDPQWGKIDVKNSDGGTKGRGSMSLFSATVASDNTVFQQLALDLGPESVAETAHDMGITSKLDGYPAEILGGLTYGVSPLEMTRAYTTINSGGWRMKPIAITKVVFPDGRVDTSLSKTQRKKVFTDGETNEAIQAMKANATSGTGTAANLGFCPTAGKTGTTTAFVDAWFAGMTTQATTVVWVGYPGRNVSMNAVPGWGTMFGGKAPASIWHDYMLAAVDKKKCKDWPQPKEPFVSQPFFGKYSKMPPPGGEDETEEGAAPVGGFGPNAADGDGTGNGGAGTGTDDTGTGNGNGNAQFPPGQYESPPQPAPQTGTGNSNAGGNGNGGGATTGGITGGAGTGTGGTG